MPRVREYEDNAARQKAYRSRKKKALAGLSEAQRETFSRTPEEARDQTNQPFVDKVMQADRDLESFLG